MQSFAKSAHGSLGVEFEGTVIARSTGEALSIAESIASCVRPSLARGAISPDYFASTLEVSTGRCSTIEEIRTDLRAIWTAVAPVLDDEDAALLGMGLHPRRRPADAVPLESPRVAQIRREAAWPADQLATNGIHVHIGMPGPDVALRTAHRLRRDLPLLLAMSASSPFHAGRLSGLASTRMSLFDAVPRSGALPEFQSWEDFSAYFDALRVINPDVTTLDCWWDVRLKPEFGTIEIRVLDSIANLDDVLALASLAWCLAMAETRPVMESLSVPLQEENRWRAIRDGVRAQLIVDAHGSIASVGELANAVIDTLQPTADALGCVPELERCRGIGIGLAQHQGLASASPGDALRTMEVNW